jgi:hypothetical protein
LASAHGLARKAKKRTSKSPQVGRDIRHSLRNGFNGLYRALVIGLSCHHRQRDAFASALT